MYSRLNTVKVKHPGTNLVRKMLNNFEIQDRDHTYSCIVHKPLGMSLAKFRSRVPKKKLPENILKLTLIHILIALEFLHTKANMIHCGKPRLHLHTFPT
jgi:serine/threonine-protein kinase SRPK3